MTDVKTIEHMWKVASNNPNHDTNWHDPVVIKFAELIAQHELEACAKECLACMEPFSGFDAYCKGGVEGLTKAAQAIRARGEA